MAQLLVNSVEIPVASGAELEYEAIGDTDRAYSGRMRSDVRSFVRVFRITTVELSASDKNALLTDIQVSTPVECNGDLVGATTDFHVRNVRVRPLDTGVDFVVSFELHETVGS